MGLCDTEADQVDQACLEDGRSAHCDHIDQDEEAEATDGNAEGADLDKDRGVHHHSTAVEGQKDQRSEVGARGVLHA